MLVEDQKNGKRTEGEKRFINKKEWQGSVSEWIYCWLVSACIFLSKVFGAPHTWDILRSGCAMPIFIGDWSACRSPEKRAVESLSVFLADLQRTMVVLIPFLPWYAFWGERLRSLSKQVPRVLLCKILQNLFHIRAEKGCVYLACKRTAACLNK